MSSSAAAIDLPDIPRWVEAHAIAADPTGWHRALGAGFAVGHDRARLIVIAGDADPEGATALADEFPTHTLLVELEREPLVRRLEATGRTGDRAILHTLPDPDALPDLEGAEPLPREASLAHVPRELADELEAVRATRSIWSAWVDGEPVSFAYAPWSSARWFDVSVDTLPAARQLGLATIVASAMIREQRMHGREPVWGAAEHNIASLRLAGRLGFTANDAVWVAPGA
jgi:hypothetical protein